MKKPTRLFLILILTVTGVMQLSAAAETVSQYSRIAVSGDFRLRSQYEETTGFDPRFREHIRLRLKGEARIAAGFRIGFGLATGGTDPRSTNQTFENMFETKCLQLDQAYAVYTAPKYLTLIGGKFANQISIWKPTDLMWDSDVTLEGAAALLKRNSLFLNTGLYILDEHKPEADPLLYVFQPGYAAPLADRIDLQAVFTYYYFKGLKGLQPEHSGGTNSTLTDASGADTGKLRYDFNPLGFSARIGIANLIFPYVSLFAEFYRNSAAGAVNRAYTYGVGFGEKKIKDRRQWQIRYLYRHLEKDAFPDFLPDSDNYGGATGTGGHELILCYGLAENVTVTFDYYIIDELASQATQYLFQTDFNFKF